MYLTEHKTQLVEMETDEEQKHQTADKPTVSYVDKSAHNVFLLQRNHLVKWSNHKSDEGPKEKPLSILT